MSRRRALGLLVGAGLMTLPRPVRAATLLQARVRHPEPRPEIDASSVMPRERVAPHVADLYDQVREIPWIVDGIGCHCGCGELPGMYSLLSCYEESGMAQYCEVCSGEGRLAYRLHQEGRSLDEIREAIDRRFG